MHSRADSILLFTIPNTSLATLGYVLCRAYPGIEESWLRGHRCVPGVHHYTSNLHIKTNKVLSMGHGTVKDTVHGLRPGHSCLLLQMDLVSERVIWLVHKLLLVQADA